MTTRTMDCIDCGESLPYGRLSCPACGALLASVAGANRGPVRVTVTSESPDRDDSPPSALVEPETTAGPKRRRAPKPQPEVAVVATATVASVRPEPIAAPILESEPVAPPPALIAAIEPEPAVVRPEPAPEREGVAVAAAAETTRSPEGVLEASEPARRQTIVERAALLTPRPYYGLPAVLPQASARRTVGPSAGYRPTTLALSAAMAGPAWPTASAGTTGAGGSGSVDSSMTAVDTSTDDSAVVDPADRYVEIAGWFVIVGATMTTLGFLLPWSKVVIGAAHIGGYFDSWGLASPTHMFVLAGVLVVLGLGIIRTPIPAWLRTGVLGLATGSLLIGLVWPYIVGPLGSDVGTLVTGLGGLALVIGGVLASWATRHALEEPSV